MAMKPQHEWNEMTMNNKTACTKLKQIFDRNKLMAQNCDKTHFDIETADLGTPPNGRFCPNKYKKRTWQTPDTVLKFKPEQFVREFKQIAIAGSAMAAITEKVWGE